MFMVELSKVPMFIEVPVRNEQSLAMLVLVSSIAVEPTQKFKTSATEAAVVRVWVTALAVAVQSFAPVLSAAKLVAPCQFDWLSKTALLKPLPAPLIPAGAEQVPPG
jgi:hypothetical protein